MKKNFMYLMAIMMIAMTSICFASCGSDDDDEVGGGGGTGSTSVVIGGEKVSLPYAYWFIKDGYMKLDLNSANMMSAMESGKLPSFWDYIQISYKVPKGQTDFESVTLSGDEYYFGMYLGYMPYEGGDRWHGYNAGKRSDSPLVITRQGNKVNISVENLELYDFKDDIKTVSLNYSSSLIEVPEEYRD